MSEVHALRRLVWLILALVILHIAHNSFKAGMDVLSDWMIEQLLFDCYEWFKQSSARKHDYIELQNSLISELDKALLPQLYARWRWLTIIPACERLLTLLPSLKNYFFVFLKKQKPTDRYRRIVAALSDKLLEAKLKFIISIAEDFRSFLTVFQNSGPLIHSLYNS